MIEVLVTIVILAIGLLGLAGMQMKIQSVEMESYQRVQAMTILNDMANRLQANLANPSGYLTGDTVGGGATESCAGKSGAALDLCEWGNALRGAGESSGGSSVGAMIEARGCIVLIQAPDATTGACSPGIYEVTVAWQGLFETVSPANECAKGLYGSSDALRRAISIRVASGTVSCV